MKQVYGTQGGGLAEKTSGGRFLFVETPDWGNYQVGDEVPREWDVQGPFDQNNGMKQISEDSDG